MRAEFAATNELREGAPVRVDGADVGEVTEMSLSDSGDTAIVEMQLTTDVDIHQDARAAVRWRTLLGGNMYVDIEPGNASAGQLAERTIPVARTTTQVEFDKLNPAVARRPGIGQRQLIREYRHGFGRPAATGRALETAGDLLGIVGRGLAPYRGRFEHDLRKLVRGTAGTLAAAGGDDGELARLVAGGAQTLGTFAARRAALGRLIRVAPHAMDTTTATLARLETTLDYADPLLVRLREAAPSIAPSARAATPALREIDRLLIRSRPLLRSLGRSLVSLAAARTDGVPLLQELAPSLRRIDEVIIPMLARRDPGTGRRTYEMVGPTASASAAAAGEFDAEGYWLRFPALGDERSLGSSPCQTYFTDPSRPESEQVRCDSLAELLGEMPEPPR